MNHLPSPVKYREDINGLRAWAVIAVLLYHFQIAGISGGFVGVDIFFVISGYLMTAIIVKGLEREDFSILKFYMARIRRILPVLMVLIAILLILGWFWLPTVIYQELGKQSTFSLTFLSNIGFWKSAGYFDIDAHEKWLLHTWSLAIEAQFYILFPIFVILLWKLKPGIKSLSYALLILLILSLALNLFITPWKPNSAFYLLPTRGWELVVGGLVYLFAQRQSLSGRSSLSILLLGWCLIIASIFLINHHMAWPGYWAIIPVLGTALVIFANRPDCRLVNNHIAQWLGDRSYSLYLWHWPLIVALNFAILDNEIVWVFSALALSLVLADLSYRYIEVPTRRYLTSKSFKKEFLVITFTGLILLISSVSIMFVSFEGRVSKNMELAASESINSNPRNSECYDFARERGSPSCIHGQGRDSIVLWGDSHGNAVVSAISKASENFGYSTMEWTFAGCPSLLGAKSTSWHGSASTSSCEESVMWVKESLNNYNNSLPLVIVNRTSVYLNGPLPEEANRTNRLVAPLVYFSVETKDSSNSTLKNEFKNSIITTSCEISKKRPVYLMRPIPEMGVDVTKTLSRDILFGLGNNDIKVSLADYHQRHKVVWEAQDEAAEKCGVKILNPLPYLCDEQYCYGSKNGRPLYYDDDHLSEYGNKFLVPMFEEVFK
ncbi:MAG: acyltransferase family protein [Pseudomonadota bacterium]|nr:acyltransferase family protein [Pseudomonadota bacterium]